MFAPLITRESLSVMEISSSGIMSAPSFVQVTDGVGTPLTGHLMVMVVFEAAVTLSPMVKVMGLLSRASIAIGLLGVSMTGLEGAVE